MANITSLGFTIFSTYDGKGVSQARKDLNDLNDDLNSNADTIKKSSDSFFSLSTAAAALGPGLIPIGAAALGVGGGLLTMGAAGAAAGGLLALAFDATLRNATSSAAAINNAWNSVIKAESDLGIKIGPALVQPVQTASDGMIHILGLLAPAIENLVPDLQRASDAFLDWSKSSDGAQKWINWIASTGGLILNAFIGIVMELGSVFGAALMAFTPMALSITDGLGRMGLAAQAWARNGGFTDFINMMKANGPAVENVFKLLGGALGNVSQAMIGLGPVSLSLTTTFLKLIASLPPSAIQAIVVAMLAFRTAMLVSTADVQLAQLKIVAMKIAILSLQVAYVIVVAATWIWSAAMTAAGDSALLAVGWIVLIVAAVAALVVGIIWLVNNWSEVWNGMKVVAGIVWQWMQSTWNSITHFFVEAWQATAGVFVAAWNAVWNGLKGVFTDVINFIKQYWQFLILDFGPLGWLIDLATHWSIVWDGIKIAAQVVWTALQIAWNVFITALQIVWLAVSAVLVAAWNIVWTGISIVAQTIWTGLQLAWSIFITGLQIIWLAVSGALVAAWNAVWMGIQIVAQAIWDALQLAWSIFITGLQTIWLAVSGALSAAWSAVWTAIQIVAQAIWDALQAAWSIFITGLQTIWLAVSGALSAAWNAVWAAMQAAAQAIWDALQAAWSAFTGAITSAYDAFSSALSAAWSAFWNAIQAAAQAVWSAIQAAWSAFTSALTAAYQAFSSALQSAWSAFWSAIQTAAQAVWSAIQAAWSAVLNAVRAAYDAFASALTSAWSGFWNALHTAAQAVWSAMQSAWSAFTGAIRSAYDSFASSISSAWSSFWNAIKSTAQSIWDTITNAFKSFTSGIQSALQSAVNAMKTVWTTIEDIFKVPVHFVIDTVINGGIIMAVNWVIGKLGGSDTAVPKVGLPFADGGFVRGPGTSKSDSIPARLSNGEYVMNANAVRKHGVSKLDAMNQGHMLAGGANQKQLAGRAKTGGFGFADGGLADSDLETLFEGLIKTVTGAAAGAAGDVAGAAGDVAGAVKGAANSVASANIPVVSNIASLIGGGASAAESAADAVKGALIGWGQSEFDQGTDAIIKLITDKFAKSIPGAGGPIQALGTGAASHTMSQLLTNIKGTMSKFLFGQQQKQITSFESIAGGSIPTADHLAVIDAAWAAAGVGGNLADWEVGMNTLIGRESGWNPNAINLTDSNATAGHPSQGLAQTIPSTFEAYHAPGTSNNILDPVANIAAAMRYIVATYGGIRNVQQAFGATPLGYANGTSFARQGWHMTGEKGPEWVNFGGGETVLKNGRTPEVSGGGSLAPIVVENHWHGNPTKEAVQYAESDMADNLRKAVMAGTGKRNH